LRRHEQRHQAHEHDAGFAVPNEESRSAGMAAASSKDDRGAKRSLP
jgi:hypothetical protein